MSLSVVETHTSTLFFVDDLVYKRKKPLDLGFSDFRTRPARLQGCREEVRLNRRLAPDVYLGVADVLGPGGSPCDHLVVMRRMPDDRRLAALVTRGETVDDALRDIARLLADLHLRSPAPRALGELGRRNALRALWTLGLDALSAFPDLVPTPVQDRTRQLALRWLDGRAELLDDRVEQGRLRDGHGDLLADDIFVLPDGPQVLDCLEFDEHLRICDGLADAAFLAMDLERLGAPGAARTFLDAYRAAMDDPAVGGLEDHYLAYRAHIRSKVTCLRARQDPLPATARAAGELAALALEHLERARVRLVLLGGLPGSGKTTIADGLAATTHWVHLSSDVTRKELGPADGDLYSAASTSQTYEALLTRAHTALVHGQSVVLDASFGDANWRARARALATLAAADLVEIVCTAPPDLADARLLSRAPGPSDATPTVRRRLAATAHPWPEASPVDTTAPIEQTVRTVVALAGGSSGPSRLLPAPRP